MITISSPGSPSRYSFLWECRAFLSIPRATGPPNKQLSTSNIARFLFKRPILVIENHFLSERLPLFPLRLSYPVTTVTKEQLPFKKAYFLCIYKTDPYTSLAPWRVLCQNTRVVLVCDDLHAFTDVSNKTIKNILILIRTI